MKHARIINVPKNPKEILDYALSKSYESWIDEKGTKDNPSILHRKTSKLTYEEAFKLIQNYKPHWVIHFRDESRNKEKDYWEFGGCNIGSSGYGEVFIWIKVDLDEASKIFKKFDLKLENY
jgi:hypothetical protein